MQEEKQPYQGTFFFDPNDPIYNDHFPGRPVVPGSLIVQAFITALAGLPGSIAVTEVERFRFKRFVGPGTYAYRLDQRLSEAGPPAWHCSLLDGDQVVVSGVLA